MTEKHLTVGSVAMSAAGRDSGRAFVVLGEADNDYVLIADGKLRKLEKPKKKKRRHLKDTGVRADDIINALNEGQLLDADGRKRLAQLGFGRDRSEEGGQDV